MLEVAVEGAVEVLCGEAYVDDGVVFFDEVDAGAAVHVAVGGAAVGGDAVVFAAGYGAGGFAVCGGGPADGASACGPFVAGDAGYLYVAL